MQISFACGARIMHICIVCGLRCADRKRISPAAHRRSKDFFACGADMQIRFACGARGYEHFLRLRRTDTVCKFVCHLRRADRKSSSPAARRSKIFVACGARIYANLLRLRRVDIYIYEHFLRLRRVDRKLSSRRADQKFSSRACECAEVCRS